MKKAVEKLSDEDILDISAYITSLPAAPPVAMANKMQ
jgi:cytochrome c553